MGQTQLSQRGSDLNRLKSDKQKRFVEEYLIDYNATRAAVVAGYSKKTAQVTGSKLLQNPIIAKFVGKYQAQQLKQNELKREEILEQLYYCVTRSARDFADEDGKLVTDVNLLNDRACAAIDGIEQKIDTWVDQNTGEVHNVVTTKLKLVPKAAAIDMAMKHKNLFAPTQHNVKHALDWDELSSPPKRDSEIEQKLLMMEQDYGQG